MRHHLGDSNINKTTMWTPQGGYNFNTPGATSGPAVFVQPVVVPPPACVNDTEPGGGAYSPACQAQVIANNLQTLANRTAANYNVDLQNCLNTFPQPPDCYERTFGLTLPNSTGGTSVDIPNAANLLGDPAAQALAAENAHNNTPAPNPPPTPPPTPPVTTTPATSPATTPAQNISDKLTTGGSTTDSTGGGSASTTPSSTTLYWIGGIAALALLFAAVK